MRKLILTFLSFLVFFSVTGCSQLVSKQSGRQVISSSLVDFLYPNKKERVVHKQEIPILKLPVKVGISFLPSQNWRGDRVSESNKVTLLKKVKASFSQYRYIENISIIPSVYLRNVNNNSGFDTLEQVARLHNVDIIALVSYDQMTQSLHNNASLLYWTIVGMYVVPGNENNIQTFVDTAIFDVRSRKMLLRAPGVSSLRKHSTAVGVDRVMNNKSLQGFHLAFDDMIKNLNAELVGFKERAKQGKIATIQHRPGYSAGGSWGGGLLIMLLTLLATKRARQA